MSDLKVIETHEGIKIVPAIEAAPGIETLEGRMGPLLNARGGGCHFIDVQPGAYMDAHAHARESLIYTVRGEWVLCSGDSRWHMRAGALFWFGDGVPTGYENPFSEPALLLIFKTDERQPGYDREMLTRLAKTRADMEEAHLRGTAFDFSELPEDHPAKVFARSIRP